MDESYSAIKGPVDPPPFEEAKLGEVAWLIIPLLKLTLPETLEIRSRRLGSLKFEGALDAN
jgi:hypothetical protein